MPDGTLVAFVSTRLGNPDVWIREFPNPRGRYRVTSREGFNPEWSPDGDTLYYWTRGPAFMDSLKAVTIDRSSGVRVRDDRTVLVTEYRGSSLHPDGDRFVIATALDRSTEVGRAGEGERYVVVINWFEELERLMSGG